ncbi:hypothetical protein B0T16DRAFT_202395 [Cercophora newfieldiana]|uniref:Uncharacterized protein n=1 Tax=Cercophora newfieldiana TaxID=92897 RepID=A0AA40CJL6_9PEZI|nr:hypothetical protein B0T16DRAFT_202395 [Cercophora newfieldiana]
MQGSPHRLAWAAALFVDGKQKRPLMAQTANPAPSLEQPRPRSGPSLTRTSLTTKHGNPGSIAGYCPAQPICPQAGWVSRLPSCLRITLQQGGTGCGGRGSTGPTRPVSHSFDACGREITTGASALQELVSSHSAPITPATPATAWSQPWRTSRTNARSNALLTAACLPSSFPRGRSGLNSPTHTHVGKTLPAKSSRQARGTPTQVQDTRLQRSVPSRCWLDEPPPKK